MRGLRPANYTIAHPRDCVPLSGPSRSTRETDALLLNAAPTQQLRERHDSTSGSGSVPTRSPQPQDSR
uniref:Uncharacterized protein n=1 Tax=Caenorhabditis japonica TaxID=281687 RepID=A0A8R1DXG6_CAEJA